jgi:hypothetical protein
MTVIESGRTDFRSFSFFAKFFSDYFLNWRRLLYIFCDSTKGRATVAGHQLAILVRDIARPARSVSTVTIDDSSQTIACHVRLFRAVVTSEGTPAHSRGVKDIL